MYRAVSPAGTNLTELLGELHQVVVREMEAMACRSRLTGDLQSAQAELLAQGLSGVTSDNLTSGLLDLVSTV